MKRALLCAVALVAVIELGQSQTRTALKPQFEVASVRVHVGEPQNQGIRLSGERVSVRSVPLQSIIGWAYGIVDLFRIPGGPGWVTSERWDIEAKSAVRAALNREQAQQMMRSLLEERFALKTHTEARPMHVYALVVGKNPPKLKENNDPEVRDGYSISHPNQDEAIAYTVTKGRMVDLAYFLQGNLGLPVLDRTGLAGRYDYRLEWRPQNQSASPVSPVSDWNAQSIADAVQEQLGLKLESTTAPIQVLVLDHVERPSEN